MCINRAHSLHDTYVCVLWFQPRMIYIFIHIHNIIYFNLKQTILVFAKVFKLTHVVLKRQINKNNEWICFTNLFCFFFYELGKKKEEKNTHKIEEIKWNHLANVAWTSFVGDYCCEHISNYFQLNPDLHGQQNTMLNTVSLEKPKSTETSISDTRIAFFFST